MKSKKRQEQMKKKRAAKRTAMTAPGGSSRYAQKRDGSAPEPSNASPPKAVCGACYLRPCRCTGDPHVRLEMEIAQP